MTRNRPRIESTVPLLYIPTSSQELADLLLNYSNDWGESLFFLSTIAKARGVIINTKEVSEIIQKAFGVNNG